MMLLRDKVVEVPAASVRGVERSFAVYEISLFFAIYFPTVHKQHNPSFSFTVLYKVQSYARTRSLHNDFPVYATRRHFSLPGVSVYLSDARLNFPNAFKHVFIYAKLTGRLLHIRVPAALNKRRGIALLTVWLTLINEVKAGRWTEWNSR